MPKATSNSAELKQAAADGSIDAVRRLVMEGANVDSVDQYGSGTLPTRNAEVMTYLLGRGADPNLQENEIGSPMLSSVIYFRDPELVNLLLVHGADPNRADPTTGVTALHCASAGESPAHERILHLLLGAGADPNASTIPGQLDFAYDAPVRTRGETPLRTSPPCAAARRSSSCCWTTVPTPPDLTPTAIPQRPGPASPAGRTASANCS